MIAGLCVVGAGVVIWVASHIVVVDKLRLPRQEEIKARLRKLRS